MTVTYISTVATSTFRAGSQVLFRWRGSVWKAVYKELSTWLAAYVILSCVYRFALDSDQRQFRFWTFPAVVIYFFAQTIRKGLVVL
jgi:hypothetical protein